MKHDLILIDRDGTICLDYPDLKWQKRVNPVLLKKTIIFLKRNRHKKIIIISNQYLVAEGYMTKRDFKKFHVKFDAMLRQHGIYVKRYYYALANRMDNSIYTKPNPGIIAEIVAEYKLGDIRNLSYIGDSDTDAKMCENAQIKFINVTEL